jgi:protein SCO1/2
MITVDPERDQVGNMDGPLLDLHPDFIGLTGSDAALAQAYKAFRIEKELAFVDPEFGPVYTHGSFVYLLDAQGKVLTLFPPILDADHVAGLIETYIDVPS